MSDSSATEKEERTTPRSDLTELRRILVGPERSRLIDLQRRLEDPEAQARSLSRLLPRAVQLRDQEDRELSDALSPTVERVIEESVQKNPNVLVRALFPIIGPMIRTSIASALRSMMESFSQTLDRSLSPRSVKWRIESWRTGRPFSEVVLLHSLRYRVEQVFLIHRETGLLLNHVVAPAVESQDPSLVSAMLRAIQDFIEDSFRVSKGEALEELQFGDLSVWIEEGPSAVLAVVIRGSAPASLRDDMERIIEQIHLQYGEYLRDLPDDTDLFRSAEDLLGECLQTGFRADPRKRGLSPAFWATVGVIILLAVVAAFFSIRDRLRWNDFLAILEAEPGVVVTRAERHWSGYEVGGLRDPLAAEPSEVARRAGLEPGRIRQHWDPYYALQPALVLRRADLALNPPDTVKMQLEEETLILQGRADVDWILAAHDSALKVPGINRLESTALARAAEENLRDIIESTEIFFDEASSDLRSDQTESVEEIQTNLASLVRLAQIHGGQVHLELIGETDPTGSWESNRQLALRRAESMRDSLADLQLSKPGLEISAVSKPGLSENGTVLEGSKRRVQFRVILSRPGEAGQANK